MSECSAAPAGAWFILTLYQQLKLRAILGRRSATFTEPAARGGAGGRGSSGSRRRRWCRRKEIAVSAIQRGRRKVGADVAAGILPAVEPRLPARRKNARNLPGAVETLNTSEIAVTIPGGRMPFSTSGKMPDATEPDVRGGAGGRGSNGPRRRRWCRQKEIAASAIQRGRRKRPRWLCLGDGRCSFRMCKSLRRAPKYIPPFKLSPIAIISLGATTSDSLMPANPEFGISMA